METNNINKNQAVLGVLFVSVSVSVVNFAPTFFSLVHEEVLTALILKDDENYRASCRRSSGFLKLQCHIQLNLKLFF